ncbi:hypothetical protein AAVH_05739 [Aphelenchoides avenae]|nr:hypothetical protein AAVH_05739 [Aphelenchus avenae]
MVEDGNELVTLRLTGGRTIETLTGRNLSILGQRDIECRHRDPLLLRIIVNALRSQHVRKTKRMEEPASLVPEEFDQWRQLIAEARYWRLDALEKKFRDASTVANTITIAYHGSLSAGRPGVTEVNFRRINRILVSGLAWVCREVFGRSLNETRDGNMDHSRYTSRFYLTHNFLEQAFDALALHRYKLVSCTSHTPTAGATPLSSSRKSASHIGSPTTGGNDKNFLHYAQFVFVRTS